MTDADVDGAHIRTLILTLLFREMQELIEAGYIYIAKPPLYKLTQGKQERYIEKDSELEEILLGDKLERFEVADARRPARSSSPTPAGSATRRLLKQYEGWAARAARRARPRGRARSSRSRRSSTSRSRRAEALLELLGRDGSRDRAVHRPSCVGSDDGVIRVKAVERKSNLARTHRLRRSLFEANEYRQLARVHAELVKLAGTPPFTVKLGDETEEALSFEDLRRAVLEVAAKGVKLQRFKGLGEMNAEQLRETTMDPETRTLAQVTMDDAAAADRLFTMLMGDKVEPRREFIEENARVATLDV